VTPAVSPVRKPLTAVVLAVALLAAVVIQLTVVNRLPLPGATAPDLVLLMVTAIAVTTSPATGAITGFAGGLALDVAPPAVHYAGEYALVFCLAGYAAARVVRAIRDTTGEHDPIIAFTVMAGAAAAGEAGKAALGMLLSDPDVTGAAVRTVAPGAILYDLLLSPLAFWLVARLTRGAAAERAPAPEFSRDQRLASVFRQASVGAVPNLRLAGTGENYKNPSSARRVPKLRLAGTGDNYKNPSSARRVPKLRLSGASSPSLARTVPAGSRGAPFPLAGGRVTKLNFAGNRPARPAKPVLHTPGKNWLRTTAASSARRSPVAGSPLAGASALRSSAFRSSGRPAAKRASRTPGRGWLRSAGANSGRRAGSVGLGGTVGLTGPRSPAAALAARSAPSGMSALSGAGTPLASRRAPSSGWLRASRSASPSRAAAGQRRSPRRGWLGGDRRPRTVIGSRMSGRGATFRRRHGVTFRHSGTAYGNWYTASPSGAWLRRGRHPWRKRRERLLRIVGVGR
jgi:rod shape-determining protein MreD